MGVEGERSREGTAPKTRAGVWASCLRKDPGKPSVQV